MQQEDFQRAFQTQIGDFMTPAESTPVQMYKASSLAGVMEELGYACTANESAFKDVLGMVGSVDEKAVAEVLGMIARTHSGLDDPSGTQASLAAALGAATLNDTAAAQTWKVEVIVDVLKASVPLLDWTKVVEHLDHEGFMVPDQKGFLLIVAAFRLASDQPFPLSAVLGKLWSNTAGQLSFLRYAVAAPPEAFTFEHCSHKQAVLEGLHAGKPPYGTPSHAWLCLDLLETLCRLAGAGLHSSVRQLLEYPLKNCPEVLLLGIAAVQSQMILQREVCDALAPQYVLSHPNSSVVLHRLWPLNRDCVLRAMVAVYEKDPTTISRILDICQELKALTFVLEQTPYPFCVELAALASRREYLNLEKWLRDRISADGATFIEATLKFLNCKLKEQQFQSADALQQLPLAGKINLSVETLAIFLRVLQTHTPSLPPELLQGFKEFQERSFAVFPQLQTVATDSGPSEAFASDVEEEANAFFQNIYNGQLSVDEAIQLLRRLKASQDQREQVVFACMIHSLFDEYQFFPQYPDKELKVTAVLFGGLIHNDFLTSISLGIALRYILDALRKPPGSKMFSFGCTALQQFKSDLLQWPQYCQQVLQVPQLKEGDPALYQHIEQMVKDEETAKSNGHAVATDHVSQLQQEPVPDDVVQLLQSIGSNQPSELLDIKDSYDAGTASPKPFSSALAMSSDAFQGAAVPLPVPAANGVATSPEPVSEQPASPGGTPDPPVSQPAEFTPVKLPQGTTVLPATITTAVAPGLHFSVINAETLESASQDVDFAVPTEGIVDKVHFLVNNLAQNNVEQKSKDLCKLIGEDYWAWLANYMVVKRAAQEPNFHGLYIELIDKINQKKLFDLLVKTTYKYVKVLLKSERIKFHTSERSLLKNLGSWLGQLTVKKNKPVLQKDLDIKGLVYEAYEQGKMIAVIPFVHKVLESCAKSKIFKPPNPWLMALLSLLAEIYALDKLKLNLKFEIEMLFKDLELPLPDIKPSDTLSAYKREMVGNPDFSQPAVPPRVEPPPATTPDLAPSSSSSPLVPPVHTTRLQLLELETKPVAAPEQPTMTGPVVAQQEGLFGNLHAYVQVSPQFAAHADKLKRVLPLAMDRAIIDIINPVVDRSVTIACCTAKELISKDFALEPDEQRMRKAAHLMVSSLAGSLALVTCKEPLRLSLSTQLRQFLPQVLPADQNFLEQVTQALTNDNLDLGCTIIEKAATDKGIREIDERLLAAYQARAKAKASNQPFVDVSFLQGRFPALPESLRPNPYQQNPQQQRVYDEFARIPCTPTPTVRPFAQQLPATQEAPTPRDVAELQRLLPGEPIQVAGMVYEKFMLWLQNMDIVAAKDAQALYAALPESSEIHAMVSSLVDIVKLATNQEQAATSIGKKIFSKIVMSGLSRLLLTSLVAALDVLRIAVAPKLPFDVMSWFCAEEDGKLFKDVGEALIRARLLHLPDLDAALAKYISSNRVAGATEFAVHIIQQCIILEPLLSGTDLYNTLDVLSRIAVRTNGGSALAQLVEQARQISRLRPSSKLGGRAPAATVKPTVDPPGLREQAVQLIDEWARLIDENPNDKVQAAFINQLQQTFFSKGDEVTERFLRIVVELSANHCLSSENMPALAARQGALSFVAIDAFVRLVLCLVNSHGAGVNLLHKVLVVVVQVLQRDAEERAGSFNARPYFRIFIGLISDLSPAEPNDPNGFNMLLTIGSGLQILQPMRIPGFAFAWLELIAHRSFMPKLLLAPGHKGWPQFQRLLVALLRFLEPYLRNADLTDAVRLLYKGTLRVLLVLLHDFPEFLCEYHFQLCDVVPPSCIQMRNLILSAFPRNMRLPDPFTPNLKVDLLPEISQSPRFLPDPEMLLNKPIKGEVDQYLKSRSPMGFLVTLKSRLLLPQHEVVVCGTRYNVPLLNGLVFYVGIQAIQYLQQSKSGGSPVMHAPAMDIFQRLGNELDTEGRYLFLNAIANQLRYPNSHTHYFSCVLLYLFAEAPQEIIQEQITRVLLERLIVNRPHPWGLLITFIELIKNPRYNFWSHLFVRCAPEIERLFESVARSCMGPQAKPEDDLVMQQNEPVRG